MRMPIHLKFVPALTYTHAHSFGEVRGVPQKVISSLSEVAAFSHPSVRPRTPINVGTGDNPPSCQLIKERDAETTVLPPAGNGFSSMTHPLPKLGQGSGCNSRGKRTSLGIAT